MVRTEGTSAGAGFYTMSKKQSSKVRAAGAEKLSQTLTVERLVEMCERHTLNNVFGDDATRLAFRAADGGPFVGYLASGQLARLDAEGVHVVSLRNSLGTMLCLQETPDGWTGGDALEKWMRDMMAALPES